MDKKSWENLGEVVRRMESWAGDGVYARAAGQRDRDRLAAKLRAARVRVKANKARNGGIYIPGR